MQRFFKMITGVLQVMFVSAGAHAMASSLVLPTSAQLAGQWELKQQDQVCALKLVEQANALEGDIACAEQWLGDKPLTWSPTPDGLLLIGKDGTQSIFLALIEAGRYEGEVEGANTLVMQRAHLQSVK